MAASSKIAILQTAFLGDTLLSLPLAKNLKQQGHPLALICRNGFVDLFLATGLFEKIFEIEKGNSNSYREAQAELNHWWSDSKSRVLVSPHESPRSKMFALGMRLKGVTTIGYGDRGFLQGPSLAAYSDRVDRSMELPEALRQLALLQSEEIAESSLWRRRISEFAMAQVLAGGRDRDGGLITVPDWASMKVDAFSSGAREQTAILTPGSVWKTKQWTREGFIEIGRRFVQAGRSVVVTGSKDEAELCREIASEIGAGAKSTAGETSLLDTARQIAKAEIAVVNDSGAMHLAAMTDTPVAAIFGPTILDFGYRPWSNKARVVEPGALSCRPCGLHGSQVCPIGTHVCMTGTSADRVWSEVRALINI